MKSNTGCFENMVGAMLVVAVCLTTAAAQLPPAPTGPSARLEGVPKLIVQERSIHLGTVVEGDTHVLVWVVENKGEAPLVISDTRASCGCTVVELSDNEKTIAPGGRLELKAKFDSTGRRGQQTKHVRVVSNDPIEPELSLEFKADVDVLYELAPTGYYRLGNLRRGEASPRSIDLTPGPDRKTVQVLGVRFRGDAPLTPRIETASELGQTGQRIFFDVQDDAPLGNVVDMVVIHLSVDGIERERELTVRGQIVGDLTISHQLLDGTRQQYLPGQQLAPITVRSTGRTPFDILSCEGGGPLEATFEEGNAPLRKTEYVVRTSVRNDAPAGPFGATVSIRTTSVDQPIIEIPVFGVVAPPIAVEPSVVFLRQDGTRIGTNRNVVLRASPTLVMEISDIQCELPAVKITLDPHQEPIRRHMATLKVSLVDKMSPGVYHSTIRLKTSIPGAEVLDIPLTVTIPN